MTIFKSKKVAALENRVNELESQLGTEPTKFTPAGAEVVIKPSSVDYTKRHFHASSATEFEAEAAKIKAIAAKARAIQVPAHKAANTPPIHRAVTTSPVAIAKPAAIAGLTTAAAFAKSVLNMVRSEFDKLNASDKARFFKEGGKLVEPQKSNK